MSSQPAQSDLNALAVDAYIFGFPLVFNLEQVRRLVSTGFGAVPPAPFNSFGHATALAGPADTFVSINNDTIYSMAQLDLRGGPLRLDVPATGQRYYVLQFVDAWTNNFAYVGTRATGNEAGTFWIVPPGFDGDLPTDDPRIEAPTPVVSIVGRWAVDGEADLPAVRALQHELALTALNPQPLPPFPEPDAGVSGTLKLFEELRVWLAAFPPSPREQEYAQRLAPLGLFEAASPYVSPTDEIGAALRAGNTEGRQKLEYALTHGRSPQVNGWHLTYHAFDYNDDFFEIGALDDPAWKIEDRDVARLERAVSARGGLWGNHGYEAAYAMNYVDDAGEPLQGDRAYTIRFDELPPVDAFWSVTMYDLPEFFLVSNPIDRYSIGDRTPGLQYAGDGSLTLVLQRNDPGPELRANWLPTPAGRFRPLLRLYAPRPAVFASYELPAIVRTDG